MVNTPRRLKITRYLLPLLTALSLLARQAQALPGDVALGTTNLLNGPTTGTNSVVLAAAGLAWTATANVSWLHLSAANQSGTGSTNVIFTIDANPGATRTGTLTIAGLTLSVTQAGSQYVAANPLTTLASGLPLEVPEGVAVDGAGNVYISDYSANSIFEWSPVSNSVTTLVSGNLYQPYGVAVDGTGNVYIADTGDSAIKEWMPANSNLTTLVSTGLNAPSGVAVDGATNIYIGDFNNGAVKELPAGSNSVVTLIPGLGNPAGVALDVASNVYIGDAENLAIYKWTAANSNLTTLASVGVSGQNYPFAVAVDGSGNVYFEDYFNSSLNMIYKWTAANSNLTPVLSLAPHDPQGVAVDGAGNLYIADFGTVAIEEIPNAFVVPTGKTEPASGGSDSLAAVLPATANLTGPFAPSSDSAWLTITGVTNGVVSFNFTSSGSITRTGNISLLGQLIPITQIAYILGTTNLLEGPAAGSDSVVLAALGTNIPWTATTNATWLHLSATNQSGTGSTNVIFSFDANPGATRTGTINIAGQTLTITQAGAPYVAANPLTVLASAAASGINNPASVTVDGAGNVYIADIYNHAIKKWTPANNTVTPVVSGLGAPFGVALDSAGNVYIADQGSNAVYKWTANGGNLTMLVSGLNSPSGITVDSAGNVYVSDTGNNLVKKWSVASSNLTTLVSSNLSSPYGLAVDAANNIYIANAGYGTITEWTAANSNLSTVVSGLRYGYGVAVDGAGHVYIADAGYNAITEWTPASNVMIELVAGLNFPAGVAVDGAGNVYIADSANALVRELPRAFVNPTAKTETANAGSDALPVVLPAAEDLLAPFAPGSDSAWLTITSVANGVVSFAYSANNGPSRTGHITVLGQSVAVTQGDVDIPLILTGWKNLGNGSFQFSFTNDAAAAFKVLSSTNVALPLSNWMVLGSPTNAGGNLFQFTTTPSTNDSQRYYRVVSP